VLAAAPSGALAELVSVELHRESAYPPYEGGPLPPHYRDAGQPFRELGGPCLYVLQELLGDIEEVDASWRSTGGDPNLAYDQWRAKVRCRRGVGDLRLSWNAKPAKTQIVLHGTRGTRRFAWKAGRFLDAVAGTPWVEKIARAAEDEHRARLASFELSATTPFLVTGASGSLGGAVVRALLAKGSKVRALVRRIPEQPVPGVEYAFGNLGDPAAVDRAVSGAETVIHAGAAIKGGWSEHLGGTVIGTQHVIDACKTWGVKQLVHISSMSVIDWAGTAARPGATVDETAALEPRPDERGPYTRAKLEAEQRVVAAAAAGLPCVILRPGQIFGGGSPLVNGAVARRVRGRWLVLGDGTLELPLVYIDDVVDAILAAVARRLTGGEIIQIIDGEVLTQADVLARAGGGAPAIKVPRALVFGLGKLSELPLAVLGRSSPVALYRLRSALARLHWGTGKAERLLGWRPRVGVHEGIRREMRQR
jgi:nucleoside-diphosphate-sugar epimerase